jgi:hypothetical protein
MHILFFNDDVIIRVIAKYYVSYLAKNIIGLQINIIVVD